MLGPNARGMVIVDCGRWFEVRVASGLVQFRGNRQMAEQVWLHFNN